MKALMVRATRDVKGCTIYTVVVEDYEMVKAVLAPHERAALRWFEERGDPEAVLMGLQLIARGIDKANGVERD